jgi:hypothetical protein
MNLRKLRINEDTRRALLQHAVTGAMPKYDRHQTADIVEVKRVPGEPPHPDTGAMDGWVGGHCYDNGVVVK